MHGFQNRHNKYTRHTDHWEVSPAEAFPADKPGPHSFKESFLSSAAYRLLFLSSFFRLKLLLPCFVFFKLFIGIQRAGCKAWRVQMEETQVHSLTSPIGQRMHEKLPQSSKSASLNNLYHYPAVKTLTLG